MLKKKRFLSLISVGLLMTVLSVSSCGGEENNGENGENPGDETNEVVTGPEGLTYKEIEDEEGNVYTGYVNEEGKYEGYGVMQYATSTLYEGMWEDGVWEGTCEITWDSGCIYIGEAHNGQMDGIGYMIWPMGDYYIGEWKEGNPNGFGNKYFMVDSTAETVETKYNIYTGDMVNGLMDGYGIMRYTAGSVYTGEWANGIRSGHGTVVWEEGLETIRYDGDFADDWINGEGTMYYSDGRVVTGTFANGELVEETVSE